VQISATIPLLELAEEPSLSLPPEPGRETLERDGYIVSIKGPRCFVERIRLGDVEQALVEVRELARERGLGYVTWWVGERSTPPDLAARLAELGLEPDSEMPVSRTLTLASPPAGEASVEVRQVESLADFRRVREIEHAVWPEPVGDELDAQTWAALAGSDVSRHYLAFVDSEPVGFGRAVFAPRATLLMGGAVLPRARGHGVYTSLVHARWRDTVERGVPRLLVGAGQMSAPILVRLGFEQIGEIRLLRDALVPHGV
jgi:GNAT superfamily N-acetyltransferase